jgi:hypothetical protein
MTRKQILVVATGVAVSIILIWAAWGLLIDNPHWDFESLSTLFSGLALGGLVVTVWIQLGEMVSQERLTQDSLRAFSKIAEVLALGQMRQNTGARIVYLRTLPDKELEAAENITPDTRNAEIQRLKSQLREVESKIVAITGEYLSEATQGSRTRPPG